MWMNEYEIDAALSRFEEHDILGPATRTLSSLRDAVNKNSDGWPYWAPPSRAAAKLMELIQQGQKWDREQYQRPRTPEPTAEQLKVALRPVKAFRTKHKFDFEIEEHAKSHSRREDEAKAESFRVVGDYLTLAMRRLNDAGRQDLGHQVEELRAQVVAIRERILAPYAR